jgi:hypothetical protein
VEDGEGKRVMKCEMCTENKLEWRGWERAVAVKVAEVQNMPHGQACTEDGPIAVILRSAHESAVQLG